MAVKVDREALLRSLEGVEPGLAPKEIVEQSRSFAFKGGFVYTYNDEVSCRAPSYLGKEFSGAVGAESLLNMLRKLTEPELTVEAAAAEVVLSGRRRQVGLCMDKEISLPLHLVGKPPAWLPLHPSFCEAVGVVQKCAGRDESKPLSTRVHLHPQWVEATDDYQFCRWELATGLESATLVRQNSIKHIAPLGMTAFGETEHWVHFKNPAGLVFSCRRYAEPYPDLGKLLAVAGGVKVSLPRGLAEAADKAQEFTRDNDADEVRVEMLPGKVRVKGRGVRGWYKEWGALDYQGPPLSFLIAPELLIELVRRHSDFTIASDRLKVDGGPYTYVTSLDVVAEEAPKEPKEGAPKKVKKAKKKAPAPTPGGE